MRLLAISYMLPPALYPQAIQIGRLLARLEGQEIGAVCGRPETAEGLDSDADFARRLAFRLDVPFRPALSGLALNLARRFVPFYARIPDEFRRWVPRAEQAVVEKLAASGFKPELLLSFGEPMSDHLLGLRLKRRLGLPWLAHFSDPWADNPFRRGQFLANAVNRRLERGVVEAADRVVFTSAETLDLVMAKYPPAWKAKAAVVPHGFEPGLYPPRRPRSGDLAVRYLGNFYGHRSPLPLCRALLRLIEREPALLKDVRFELVGNLSPRMKLHPAWRRLPEGLVAHKPTVSHARSCRTAPARQNDRRPCHSGSPGSEGRNASGVRGVRKLACRPLSNLPLPGISAVKNSRFARVLGACRRAAIADRAGHRPRHGAISACAGLLRGPGTAAAVGPARRSGCARRRW